MGGFAGIVRSERGAEALGRMAAAPTIAPWPKRYAGSWLSFGARDVDLAETPANDGAIAIWGYVRDDAGSLTASQVIERWTRQGPRILATLSGEFALAVRCGGEVHVARDRLGTRPLYVAELPRGGLAFSTAIAPLVCAGAATDVDRDAVVRSLVLGYVNTPLTALRAVRQLGPGEVWQLAPRRRARRYFQLVERIDAARTLREAVRDVDRVLTSAVEHALPSQGCVGAFLSGGLDSSLILARVVEAGAHVDAFTLHFGDNVSGEIRYARAVARHLGVRHHVLTLDAARFRDGIEPSVEQLEDVVAEAIAIPNFLLASEAARSVDVLFTGEGGDQSFGGPKNIKMVLARAYFDHPRAPSLGRSYFAAHHYLADDLDVALEPGWRASFAEERLAGEIVTPYFDDRAGAPGDTFVGRVMIGNTVVKGGSNILVKASKMIGAAHDLALRSPMFDPSVVALASTIPPWHKQWGVDEKLVLKKAAERSLPRRAVYRTKRGMSLPLATWLFEPDLAGFARDVLTRRAVKERGIFRWSYVERLLRGEALESDFTRSRTAAKLWLVLMTELQHRALGRLAAAARRPWQAAPAGARGEAA